MTGVVPGSITISSRALGSCARAITAERLGVPTDRVRVDLADEAGALALDITTPIRMGDGLVDAVQEGAVVIRERLTALTGRRVSSARIELTGIVRSRPRRVA
jgi:hypothetical protein